MEEESINIERSQPSKWQTLKRKLRLRGLACCGSLRAAAGPAQTNHRPLALDESPHAHPDNSYSQQLLLQLPPNSPNAQHCLNLHPNPAVSTASMEEINLAAALAAERQFRTAMAKPSLMRLLEEKERERRSKESEEEEEEGGLGSKCCVCMGRKKGAAFIPCGHTFCRVCAQELWASREACALCNRPIVEILDIF